MAYKKNGGSQFWLEEIFLCVPLGEFLTASTRLTTTTEPHIAAAKRDSCYVRFAPFVRTLLATVVKWIAPVVKFVRREVAKGGPVTLGHSNRRKYTPVAKRPDFDHVPMLQRSCENGHKSTFSSVVVTSVARWQFAGWVLALSPTISAKKKKFLESLLLPSLNPCGPGFWVDCPSAQLDLHQAQIQLENLKVSKHWNPAFGF